MDEAGLIGDNDAVIFFNLRSDRARQITKSFVQTNDFNQRNPGAFQRKKVLHNLEFISMTDFGPDLDSIVSAFPSPDLLGTLPSALNPLRQLYIAESEKYAHVTYFLNGGTDHPVNGEVWQKIPSPANPDYSQTPDMSAANIVDYVIDQVQKKNFDIYVLNFANADMLGHTGKFEATVEAIEAIDDQIGRLWQALHEADPHSVLCITADHGNAEEMINIQTKELDTEHSMNKVPLIITRPNLKLRTDGGLSNVAPTLLKLLGLKQPKQMTAEPLC